MKKKIILSIETSLSRIYLAVSNGDKVFTSKKNICRSIEVDLNLLLQTLLEKAQINFRQLDKVLISLGPGSFTGTRVGLSAARAIATSLNIEIFGYSNFFSIIQQASAQGILNRANEVNILIQATNSELYYQKYFADRNIFGEMKVMHLEEAMQLESKKIIQLGISKQLQKHKNFVQVWPKAQSFLTIKDDDISSYFFREPNLLPIYIKQHYAYKSREQ